jgi:hypothetical protein
LRLRNAGLSVLGFSRREPGAGFRAACSDFEVIDEPAPKVSIPVASTLTPADVRMLRKIIEVALAAGPIRAPLLRVAIRESDASLAARLPSNGKFVKTLEQHGLVQRVDKSSDLVAPVSRAA